MTGTDEYGQISDEARDMAASVRERAARMPTAEQLAAHAMDRPGGEMSPAQIRRLALEAISQAQKVSFLLGQLAGLLEDSAAGEP